MRRLPLALLLLAGPALGQPSAADSALVERYLEALDLGSEPLTEAVRAGIYADHRPDALAELVAFFEGPLAQKLDAPPPMPVRPPDAALIRRHAAAWRSATFPTASRRRTAETVARSLGEPLPPLALDAAGRPLEFEALVAAVSDDLGFDEEGDLEEAERMTRGLTRDEAVAVIRVFESDAGQYQGRVLGDAFAVVIAEGTTHDLEAAAVPPPAPPLPPPGDLDDEVLDIAEVQPEIVGGLEALQRLVEYPEDARVAGAEGTVVVQFVVRADGSVTDLEAVRSPDARLSHAALEAVRAARFTPGRHRGRAVSVRLAVPIGFRLR